MIQLFNSENIADKLPDLAENVKYEVGYFPESAEIEAFKEIGKQVGEELSFGGLLGSGPVMPLSTYSPAKFISRGGRIPAPMQSLKN